MFALVARIAVQFIIFVLTTVISFIGFLLAEKIVYKLVALRPFTKVKNRTRKMVTRKRHLSVAR